MVRNYKRKTNRADLSENDISCAIKEVLNNRMSERVASRNFNVKRGTLHSRISKLKRKYPPERLITLYNDDSGKESDDENQNIYSSKYNVSQVFTSDQENELVKYIQTCSDMNYGLTYKQIRVLAYDYASALPKCNIIAQWKVNKIAGIEWLKCFMKRNNHKISLRKPESTSLARSTGFNKRSVSEFFENYSSVLSKYNFKPEQIYNLDETGVTTVLKPVKIVSTKGKRQVSQTASAERGELTTFVGIINAVGNALPPAYVFPRIRNPDDYLIDAPTSSIALGNQSGWMTGDLFLRVLEHIKKHTNCSNENKILLLLDNHESHTTVRAINFCRENGIVMLSFPPHTSHKLQPLDVGVYGPFKSYCSVAFNDWMVSNPGKTITIRQIAHLTRTAFQNAFIQGNITKSFEKPGLWPLNRLVFKEDEFLPSFANHIEEDHSVPHQEADALLATVVDEVAPRQVISQIECGPSTSSASMSEHTTVLQSSISTHSISSGNTPSTQTNEKNKFPKSSNNVTPEIVRPFPRATLKKVQKGNSRKGKSRILTTTPEKNRLEEIEFARERRKQIQCDRNKKRLLKQVFPDNKMPVTKNKRKMSTSSSESEESIILESDEISDEFSDVENEHLITEDGELRENHFVLVKFPTKVSVFYYVGKIIECLNHNEFQIKYLRRKTPGYKFYYPLVDDISTVDRSDLMLKLPDPNSAKTARTSSLIAFNLDLSSYNIM